MRLMERFRVATVWIVIAASLVPLWVAAQLDHRYLNDDALITLTYAKNLARGDGFVYNHPPPVLGTTTPLFTVLVAGAARIAPFLEPTALALLLSALCWIGLVWTPWLFRSEFHLSDAEAAILALVLAVSGWVRHLEMEAYLFGFLLVVSAGLFFRRRPLWAGVAAAMLFLTRGEGALVFGLLFAMAIFHDRRGRAGAGETPRRTTTLPLCIGFGVPVLAWCLYAVVRFGNIFPNTLSAKVAQGASGLWRPFLEALVEGWMPAWGRGLAIGSPWLGLWYPLAIVGLVVVLMRKRRLGFFLVWIAAYIVGYSLLGVAGYPWYSLPVYLVLVLLVGVGLGSLVEVLRRLRASRPAGKALGIALVMVVVVGLGRDTVRNALRAEPTERAIAYYELARWLRENTDRSASVAYHEIGYLGYYTDNRIIDLCGLVTPEITPYVAIGDFGWGFWRHRPDLFVHLEGSRFFDGIVGDQRFRGLYRPVARFPGQRGLDLTVYRRVDASGRGEIG
jgi:hypothetical protein